MPLRGPGSPGERRFRGVGGVEVGTSLLTFEGRAPGSGIRSMPDAGPVRRSNPEIPMPSMRRPLAAVLVAWGLGLPACGKDEHVVEIGTGGPIVDPVPTAPPRTSAMERFGSQAGRRRRGAVRLDRTRYLVGAAPAPMRVVGFRVGGDPGAECTLAVFAGDAGGLLANVNRWRSQMGLEPIDEAALAALPKRPLLGGDGDARRTRGALRRHGRPKDVGEREVRRGSFASCPPRRVFVKLVGPAAIVDAEAGALRRVLRVDSHARCARGPRRGRVVRRRPARASPPRGAGAGPLTGSGEARRAALELAAGLEGRVERAPDARRDVRRRGSAAAPTSRVTILPGGSPAGSQATSTAGAARWGSRRSRRRRSTALPARPVARDEGGHRRRSTGTFTSMAGAADRRTRTRAARRGHRARERRRLRQGDRDRRPRSRRLRPRLRRVRSRRSRRREPEVRRILERIVRVLASFRLACSAVRAAARRRAGRHARAAAHEPLRGPEDLLRLALLRLRVSGRARPVPRRRAPARRCSS